MTREQTDALRAMLHEELSAATERIARVEPITVGIAEPARRHREEDRQLWRDTQNQVARLAQEVDRFVLEAATRDQATNGRLANWTAWRESATTAFGNASKSWCPPPARSRSALVRRGAAVGAWPTHTRGADA